MPPRERARPDAGPGLHLRVRILLELPESGLLGVGPCDLHGDDVDEYLETLKVIGVRCVKRQLRSARRCRDQEVHGTRTAGLAPLGHDGCVDPRVRANRFIIEREGMESRFGTLKSILSPRAPRRQKWRGVRRPVRSTTSEVSRRPRGGRASDTGASCLRTSRARPPFRSGAVREWRSHW